MLDRNESMLYSDKYLELDQWATPAEIVYEDKAIAVREYKKVDSEMPALIVIPPQSGHNSKVVDFDVDQSQCKCAMDNYEGSVYCIDWKPCTLDRANETYEDLISQLDTTIKVAGTDKVHLVSDCQGSILAIIYTALYPEKVASLSISGAPVDPHASPSVLDYAIKCVPMWFYKSLVASFKGVMSGEFMVAMWRSSNLKLHYFDRYQEDHDNHKAKRMFGWYNQSQDIAGGWFLFIVENLFKKNKLIKNELEVCGRVVNLKDIKCDLNILVGEKDDISPAPHSLCLVDAVSTPIEKIKTYVSPGGHIGLYCGTSTIKTIWTEIFKNLNSQS